MDVSLIQPMVMPIVVAAFGIFAGFMFIYRNMTTGDQFSFEKFLPTMGVGAIAALFLYATGGVWSISGYR